MDPLTEAIRSMVQDDVERGVSQKETFDCQRCGMSKRVAGSKDYGHIRLCNDCVLVYARRCFSQTDLQVDDFLNDPVPEEEHKIHREVRDSHIDGVVAEEEEHVREAHSEEADSTELDALRLRVEELEGAMDTVWDMLQTLKMNKPRFFRD